MPKISVIVPVYNTEQFLPRCIDSILSQTFTDFELLLIDDGSKDNSGRICDEYATKDSRIRVFHKENGGVSSARDLGIDNAQGEWITFVDSDDILYENALSALSKHSHDADLITANITQDHKEWENTIIGSMSASQYVKGLLSGECFGYLFATLYRSTLFPTNRIKIPKDLKIGEDVLFKLELSKRIRNAVNIPDVIYYYRTNPSSVMQSQARSVQYYSRYFKFRNTLITKDLAETCKTQDVKTLIDAFCNPHIPYRKEDYALISNVIKSTTIPNEYKKKAIKLKHKPLALLSKLFSHYRTKLSFAISRKPQFGILD